MKSTTKSETKNTGFADDVQPLDLETIRANLRTQRALLAQHREADYAELPSAASYPRMRAAMLHLDPILCALDAAIVQRDGGAFLTLAERYYAAAQEFESAARAYNIEMKARAADSNS